MRHFVPECEYTTVIEEGDLLKSSLNDGDVSVLPDPVVLETIPWLDASCSLSTGPLEAENFEDIFRVLQDVQLHPTLSMQATSSALTEREIWDAVDERESSGRKRKADDLFDRKCQREGIGMVSEESKTKQDESPKTTRSADIHNMSERRRRDRIKGKMRALQELIPNCNKSDRASMLDDAIEYLKALKLQVQMMSTGGEALCQVPCMPPAGIQCTQIPQASPFMHMRPSPGFGMGMSSMSCSTGLPMMSVPSFSLHPFPSAAAGFYLIYGSGGLPVPQLQVPLIASQVVPSNTVTSSTVLPQFTGELFPPFNHSNHGDSISQIIDSQQLPILRQTCNPPGSS